MYGSYSFAQFMHKNVSCGYMLYMLWRTSTLSKMINKCSCKILLFRVSASRFSAAFCCFITRLVVFPPFLVYCCIRALELHSILFVLIGRLSHI